MREYLSVSLGCHLENTLNQALPGPFEGFQGTERPSLYNFRTFSPSFCPVMPRHARAVLTDVHEQVFDDRSLFGRQCCLRTRPGHYSYSAGHSVLNRSRIDTTRLCSGTPDGLFVFNCSNRLPRPLLVNSLARHG